MLPAVWRLPLRSQKGFFLVARRTQSRNFRVLWTPSSELSSRFAIIIPKTVGKAHDRQLLRRQTRHLLIDLVHQSKLGSTSAYDIAIQPRRSKTSYQERLQELTSLLVGLT